MTKYTLPFIIKIAGDPAGNKTDRLSNTLLRVGGAAAATGITEPEANETPKKRDTPPLNLGRAAMAGLGVELSMGLGGYGLWNATEKNLTRYDSELGERIMSLPRIPEGLSKGCSMELCGGDPAYVGAQKVLLNIGKDAPKPTGTSPAIIGHEIGHAINQAKMGKSYDVMVGLTHKNKKNIPLAIGAAGYLWNRNKNDKAAKNWAKAGLIGGGIGHAFELGNEGMASINSLKLMREANIPDSIYREGRGELAKNFGTYLATTSPLVIAGGLYAWDRHRIKKHREQQAVEIPKEANMVQEDGIAALKAENKQRIEDMGVKVISRPFSQTRTIPKRYRNKDGSYYTDVKHIELSRGLSGQSPLKRFNKEYMLSHELDEAVALRKGDLRPFHTHLDVGVLSDEAATTKRHSPLMDNAYSSFREPDIKMNLLIRGYGDSAAPETEQLIMDNYKKDVPKSDIIESYDRTKGEQRSFPYLKYLSGAVDREVRRSKGKPVTHKEQMKSQYFALHDKLTPRLRIDTEKEHDVLMRARKSGLNWSAKMGIGGALMGGITGGAFGVPSAMEGNRKPFAVGATLGALAGAYGGGKLGYRLGKEKVLMREYQPIYKQEETK